MADLFVAKNPVELAQEFQWGIDMAGPDEAAELAKNAVELIGDVQNIYGARRLIIHSLSAYILDRGLTIGEQTIIDHQFDEIILTGHFGGLPYVEQLTNPRLQTFMLDMYDVTILESTLGTNPTGKISSPLLLPVLDTQCVLVAA